jgi:hypothetical protein
MSKNIPSIWINKIENGYIITGFDEKTFCTDNIEVIKNIAKLLNVEIGVEIKEKI